jgi:hypothetical protein
MVHPDLLAPMESPVGMDNPANPEMTVNPVKDRPPNNNLNGASIAHLDQPDHPETTEIRDNPADLDNPEPQEVVVDKAHPDLPVPPDPTETPATPEAMDNPVDPDKCTKFPAQKAHLDLQVPLVNPETTVNRAIPETPEDKVKPDLPEMLAVPDNQVDPETQELPETMERVVATEDATIALPHVPLPDIKLRIQLSRINFQHTAIVLFSFIFCIDLYEKIRFMEKI